MIEVMKLCHQEVNVVDMSAIVEEVRQTKIAKLKATSGVQNNKLFASAAPTYAEVDHFLTEKFIQGTTMGLSMKIQKRKNLLDEKF